MPLIISQSCTKLCEIFRKCQNFVFYTLCNLSERYYRVGAHRKLVAYIKKNNGKNVGCEHQESAGKA